MNLDEHLKQYWTDNKTGKYNDIIKEHKYILENTAKANYDDIFEQYNENIFKLTDFLKPISWNNLFKNILKLYEYMKPEYIKMCLDITSSSEPAIGAGEFLFAASFKNLGFSKESGDLIDLNNNAKIEFKGKRSSLAGYGNIWKEMNNSVVNSVLSLFNKNSTVNYLNEDMFNELDELINKIIDKTQKYKAVKTLFNILQNLKKANSYISDAFANYYLENQNVTLFNSIAAMQLFTYMYINKSNILILLDKSLNQGCKGFSAPKTPEEAYKIITDEKIKISSWYEGKCSVEISLGE